MHPSDTGAIRGFGHTRTVRLGLALLAPVIGVALAACGPVGAINIPLGGGAATAPPTDLNVAPATTDPLAPAGGNVDPNAVVVVDPLAAPDAIGQPDQVAMLAANTDITLTLDDLVGAWTVAINSGSCQLFLASTPWETGYRGSTRDCPSTVLNTVSSWSLIDQQIVLYSGGAEIARLYAVSLVRNGDLVANARFEGQLTSGGTPVAFFR